MFSASSWAMKRVYKFLLKRLLGKLLVNEIDLEQLEVQLGAGTLELRDLLLDTDYLNAQLGEKAAVTVTAGYIGNIKATVPWKGLTTQPIEINIDELEVTVAPRPLTSATTPSSKDEKDGPSSPTGSEGGFVDAGLDTGGWSGLPAYAGVDDGVRVVARLVESILLGLKVKATRLVVRLEQRSATSVLAADVSGHVSDYALVLKVPFAEYKDETPVGVSSGGGGWGFLGENLVSWGSDKPPEKPAVVKTLSFKGVQIALERPAGVPSHLERTHSHSHYPGVILSGAEGGADGSVRVSMQWKGGSVARPKLDLEVLARPLELHIDLADVSTLSALASSFQGGRRPPRSGHSFDPPSFVQTELALHELAHSGLQGAANPTGLNKPGGVSEGGFRAQKEDLLQSQYFSQQQADELARSVRAGDAGGLGFGNGVPGWLRGEEGGLEEEANLAASVDDFFDCLNGTASGHLSRSAHSSGRRSVTWGTVSEIPFRSVAESETGGYSHEEVSPGSGATPVSAAVSQTRWKAGETTRAGWASKKGTGVTYGDPLREVGVDRVAETGLDGQPAGSSEAVEYSVRAKIAGLKLIVLAPGLEKTGRKRKGEDPLHEKRAAEEAEKLQTGLTSVGAKVAAKSVGLSIQFASSIGATEAWAPVCPLPLRVAIEQPANKQGGRGKASWAQPNSGERPATGLWVSEAGAEPVEAKGHEPGSLDQPRKGTGASEAIAGARCVAGVFTSGANQQEQLVGTGPLTNVDVPAGSASVSRLPESLQLGFGQSSEGLEQGLGVSEHGIGDSEEGFGVSERSLGGWEQGLAGWDQSAKSPVEQDEDNFADALDADLQASDVSIGGWLTSPAMRPLEGPATLPSQSEIWNEVSGGVRGSNEGFGLADHVVSLPAWQGGLELSGHAPPCEIVEREWSPELEEPEAVEVWEKRADKVGALEAGTAFGGLDAAGFSGGENVEPFFRGPFVGRNEEGAGVGAATAGDVALEMPLDDGEELGYGMRGLNPGMSSVFGRESLLAWSGAGSEHWNEEPNYRGFVNQEPQEPSSTGGQDVGLGEDRGSIEETVTEDLSNGEPELKEQEGSQAEFGNPRNCVEAVCAGLSFSLAVTSSSTSIEIASDTFEVAELIYSLQLPGGQVSQASASVAPPLETALYVSPREKQLQQVEAALSCRSDAAKSSVRHSPHSQTGHFKPFANSPPNLPVQPPGISQPSDPGHLFERRKLVKVRSGPPITKPAVVVHIVLNSVAPTGHFNGGKTSREQSPGRQKSLRDHSTPPVQDTQLKAELQPVTLILDLGFPERLKRFAVVPGGSAEPEPAVTPVPLLRASQVLPSPRRSFDDFLPSKVLPRLGSSPVDDIIDDLDRQLSGKGAKAVDSKHQRGALSVTISSPCFRVILSFLDNERIGSIAHGREPPESVEGDLFSRGDCLALDLSSNPQKGSQNAILSYESSQPEPSPRGSFSAPQSSNPGSSVTLGAANLALYLVTDSFPTGDGASKSTNYRAFSLLSVSTQPSVSRQSKESRKEAPEGLGVSLWVRLNPSAEVGEWLPQLVWEGASAQKMRGDGGRGVDNNQHGETAAARASAADEDLMALEIREKAIASSPTSVQLTFDHATLEVVRWRVERLTELLDVVKGPAEVGLENGLDAEAGMRDGNDSDGASLDGRKLAGAMEKGCKEDLEEAGTVNQFAFLLNVAVLDVRLAEEGASESGQKMDECRGGVAETASKPADEKNRWVSFRANLNELTFFHVSNLGGASENSYTWVRHEHLGMYGTLQNPDPPSCDGANGLTNGGVELLLLTCSDEVLGRGDAGDENALAAPGTVGLTISVVSYPSGGYDTDSIVGCSLRGGTVMAPAGRLDWLAAAKELAVGGYADGSDAASDGFGKDRPNASERLMDVSREPIYTASAGEGQSRSVRQREKGRGISAHSTHGSSGDSGVSKGTCFLLDLHDLALCYEPTLDPIPSFPSPGISANSSPLASKPSLSRQNSMANAASPVSAILAVAALRVSSVLGAQSGGPERLEEEGGETEQEQVFDIWLRDAALLILDNAVRRPAPKDFTTSSLAQAGFVQVAREAVLEACVRTHTAEGLQWELDCTHNQLRLDTCQDTTAALGRLAGQIQALVQADMEPADVAGGGAVIHRRSGDQDPADLLRSVSEASQMSASPSLSSSLASETSRSAQRDSEAVGTLRESFRNDGTGRWNERDGLEGRVPVMGWEAGALNGEEISGEFRNPGQRNGGESGRRSGPESYSPVFANPSNPSTLPRQPQDNPRPGGLMGAWATPGREETARTLPEFYEDFYIGLEGRAPSVKPGTGESIHSLPGSRIKQPIWTGDPVSVHTPRTQVLDSPTNPNWTAPSRSRKPVSLTRPNVHKPRVKEHDASWFDGKMPPLSEDYVVRPSGSPPKEELGQPWLRNRAPGGSKSRGSLPKKYPKPVGRLLLRDLSVRWRLYGGRDWGSAPGSAPEAPRSRIPNGQTASETRSRTGSAKGASARDRGGVGRRPGGLVTRPVKPTEDGLEGWSTVSVEPGLQPRESPRPARGAFPGAIDPPSRSGRQKENCLEVLLDGVDLQHDSFPQRDHYASRLAVSVRDITVYDFSKAAPWRMIMGHYRSATCPRESGSKALKVEMDAVRPDTASLLEEYRLMLALLPLRLHLDQRHIDFCADFFSGGQKAPESPGNARGGAQYNDVAEEAFLPYFQKFEMRPLTIRVDYLPRRIDLLSLRNGNYAELLNLVTWEGVELRLKGVRASGAHGWDGVGAALMNDWVEDISQHQLNKIVRGVAPIRPLYEVGRATAQLLMIPAEQYKKDKRLLKGLRKGAAAFLKGVSLEALGLGAQLAAGAHELLQQAEATLSGDSQSPGDSRSAPNGSPLQISQPQGTREGLKQAFESVSRGLERSASSVISAPIKRYQRSGSAGKAVATALRAAPAAVVAPAAATAGAVHRALLGVRNELDPERKREIDEKHAPPPPDGRRRQ